MDCFTYRQCHGLLWGALLGTLLAGCSTPTGTSRLYKPSEAGNDYLHDNVFANTATPLTIRKGPGQGNGDVFAIYLSDAYFKYLRDWSGVNELVIVAEFTETHNGGADDKVTRVLGPYFGTPDHAEAPFQNKLLYGPKKLDSDQLNMKLTVLEYDQGENANTANFLDFIQSASQSLSLADPLTGAEQIFAKEVAKSLLALNKDDVAMAVDINFTAADSIGSGDRNGSVVPLNAGDYVLVSTEHCVPANCYLQLTENGTTWNPFAWLGDVVLLVPTAMRRAWSDSPDHDALDPTDQLKYSGHRLTADGKPYTDKNWLALSIVKGGDDSLWQQRKLLTEAETSVQKLIRLPGGQISTTESFKTAATALEAARRNDELNRSGVVFISPLNTQGDFAPSVSEGEYCLFHSRDVAAASVTGTFYRYDANGVPQQLPASAITRDSDKATPNNTCFDVDASGRQAGDYEAIFAYRQGSDLRTQRIRYRVVP